MSQIIKKNRRYLAGIALPAFFLFLLWAVGVSVYPGWVSPVYGVPGTPCDNSNPGVDCDLCAGEICTTNPDADGQFQCAAANGSFATPSPVPQCPRGIPNDGDPSCYRDCQEVDIQGVIDIECFPDDSYCDEISGGAASNECRIGMCLEDPDVETNPSGCDYELAPDADENCVLCISPEPLAFDHCGNGVCEPEEGEDCNTCPIDCNPPGYDGACLEAGDPVLDGICLVPAGIKFITFPGPPYPTGGQFPGEECEDGNLCTDNVCGDGDTAPFGQCVVTDKECNPDPDFCCPAGCSPPTTGSCRDVTGAPIPGCDPDCYEAIECPIPTPTPTPTPTVPPFNAFLEGSGCNRIVPAGSASSWFWGLGFAALAGFGFKRRQR